MKNKSLLTITLLAVLVVAGFVFNACNKKFDAPPEATDPNMTATHTIKQLKAMHTTSAAYDLLSTDIIVSGVVIANDKSGNLYKNIYIQDATGALNVLLDANSLYTNYPIGRRIFIKCKGLYLSDYRGLIQLGVRAVTNGTPSMEGIPASLIDNYVVRGSLNNAYTVKTITGADFSTNMQSDIIGNLVKIENAEITDWKKTYADTSAYKAAGELKFTNCAKDIPASAIIRTSGYANFAGQRPLAGKGDLYGIYTIYSTTPQLIVRDTSDVKLYNATRCDGSVAGPPTYKSIADIRTMYSGTDVTLGNFFIRGIVISDAAVGKNIANGNMYIQDGERGIDLYFGSSANTAFFNVGDSIQVDVSGGTLTKYNGLLEISLASASLPTSKLGTGKVVTPKQLTIAQIIAGIDNYEGSLVKIVSVAPSAAGTYAGNKTIADASGSMTLYTLNQASFATSALTTDCKNLVGIPSRFNAVTQLQIRDLNDVTVGTGCTTAPPPAGSGITLTTSPYTIDFNGLSSTGLPTGVSVKTGATASALGTDGTIFGGNITVPTIWANVSAGFKNFASATGLTATADQATQDGSTNRALGLRQTGSNGDPGGAFVFQLANTTGKTNLKMNFKLQSLDNTSTRTVTWSVDYGIGDNPTTFTTVATTGTVTTGNSTFSNNTINVDFGSALNNQSSKVWIRVVALSASTGSSNRPSTAIDDVQFTW